MNRLNLSQHRLYPLPGFELFEGQARALYGGEIPVVRCLKCGERYAAERLRSGRLVIRVNGARIDRCQNCEARKAGAR